jgi:nicotinamide mononucleotide transporter
VGTIFFQIIPKLKTEVSIMQGWTLKNYIELLGVITSVLFTILSIRQKPAAWIFGICSAVFYALVYFQNKLYASMALQGYYFVISIYGWFYWLKGVKKEDTGDPLPVQLTSFKFIAIIFLIGLTLNILLWYILRTYTDSPYPVLDSLTTTVSIIATWMLARKYIENWILWIGVDIISIWLYFYIKLYPTAILFIIYTVLAIIGYIEWEKSYKKIKS